MLLSLRDARWSSGKRALSSIEMSKVQLPARAEICNPISAHAPTTDSSIMSPLTAYFVNVKIMQRGRGLAARLRMLKLRKMFIHCLCG